MLLSTEEYIRWAQAECPEPLAKQKAPLDEACKAYDRVDDRLGDAAEGNEFLTKALWLETAIRLAELGWTIEELERCRWPLSRTQSVRQIIRSGF